jgi:hypothetical protein
VGTALLINIVVEVVVVRGDIGRMNTVFKFYLQGWALLSVSAAAAFAWLLPEVRQWLPGWRRLYQIGASALLTGAALFTISAATDKMSDRMTNGVPLTLDSITYMQYAEYADFDVIMDLPGLSRHPLDAGSCAGFAGHRGGQLHRVPLVHALHHLHRPPGRRRLELASAPAARPHSAPPHHGPYR